MTMACVCCHEYHRSSTPPLICFEISPTVLVCIEGLENLVPFGASSAPETVCGGALVNVPLL